MFVVIRSIAAQTASKTQRLHWRHLPMEPKGHGMTSNANSRFFALVATIRAEWHLSQVSPVTYEFETTSRHGIRVERSASPYDGILKPTSDISQPIMHYL
uniref:Secreted protein n=1 Tax=Panagrellus redivivus TaxID=6233 RepID=A0A7E4VAV3_PANRE